jgi:GTP-binding protein
VKITSIELTRRARRIEDLPEQKLPEIAFAGRSNVGKSSAINSLIGRQVLSPVSRNPGRTREILFFLLNRRFFFVDLPGYGFAKRTERELEYWRLLMEAYFSRDSNPTGVVHILDIRHDPSPLDRQLIEWLAGRDVSILFLLTKSDKMSRGRVSDRRRALCREIGAGGGENVVTFSARTGAGRSEAWSAIDSLVRGA